MKVVFLSETNFNGKYDPNFTNARTDVAWQKALNAYHECIDISMCQRMPNVEMPKKYDIAIVILPKNSLKQLDENLISNLQKRAKKVGIMQEGPNWFFQDYPAAENYLFYKFMLEADFILCHNEHDRLYYRGLLNRDDVFVMPSTMKDVTVKSLVEIIRDEKIMIGGGFTSWYSGFDSYIVTQQAGIEAEMPSMGRRQENEESWGIKHLPYENWLHWIHRLNTYKYGIHLMRTFAAGTFSMNCAGLGIPCIGYKELDTQRNLHPQLSVDIGDLGKAVKLLKRLKDDEDFYNECSKEAKENFFNSNYYEPNYRTYMNKLFYKILEKDNDS